MLITNAERANVDKWNFIEKYRQKQVVAKDYYYSTIQYINKTVYLFNKLV